MTHDPPVLPDRVPTADGLTLEARWSAPDAPPTTNPSAVAVLTHPHPRFGGDLHNIVPATLSRELPNDGIATLRVNFRGVGASTGTHGGGEAEVTDLRAAIDCAVVSIPGVPLVGVGYSFGADVLLATDDDRLDAVVAIAPPLAVLPIDRLAAPRGRVPTLILSPVHDQFRTASDAATVVEPWPDTTVVPIEGADHFLAGSMSVVAPQVAAFVLEVARTD